MKVLFAVSNDEISEAIVKRYQRDYKEIISYKNVYYFNAILKELQKDKSYDRIVISEELEAFTSTQADQIDKIIFEKLDRISDEAANNKGDNTPIILICSDRRTKGEEMLVKLFGIGIYDALIGNDRSVGEVCRLINKTRSKKEAKIYYKVDSDEVKYQPENENDVSEQEIQNILAHYKRLGKNEEKYVTSFNNIVAQYNDAQLRIISKFLPLNVRAVLEEKSPKYQQIMSFNNAVTNNIRKTSSKQDDLGPSGKLLKPKNQTTNFTGPIVIPSSVDTKNVKKMGRKREEESSQIAEDLETMFNNINNNESFKSNEIEKTVSEVKPAKRRGRPRKNPLPEENDSILPGFEPQQEDNDAILPGFESQPEEDDTMLPGFESQPKEDDAILPGFEPQPEEDDAMLPGFESQPEEENAILPGFENVSNNQEDQILPGFEYVQEQNNNPNPFLDDNVKQDTSTEQFNSNPFLYQTENTEESKAAEPEEDYDYNDNEQENYNVKQFNNVSNYNSVQNYDVLSNLGDNKKIATFVGTSKNGTSFIVNNLAEYASSMGINVAILDTTVNKNSYYIYTKNEEELRKIASTCLENLINGQANGITVNRNLTVYTSLPEDRENLQNASQILDTLTKKHDLILIDTDFNTPFEYFSNSHNTYLVQSLDILTIQPLTAFLRELKAKGVLEESKIKVLLNKYVRVRGISEKTIIGGMSKYNDPAMSFMTDLFDVNSVDYKVIPFEQDIYTRYLESVINCDVSIKGYSKQFLQILKDLNNWVYPMSYGKNSYRSQTAQAYDNTFSSDINSTLSQMRKKY